MDLGAADMIENDASEMLTAGGARLSLISMAATSLWHRPPGPCCPLALSPIRQSQLVYPTQLRPGLSVPAEFGLDRLPVAGFSDDEGRRDMDRPG